MEPPPAKRPAASARDWSELPLDELSSVFARLGNVEVLMGASFVCRSWLQAAKMPSLWRSVDVERHDHEVVALRKMSADAVCAMAKVAVDRSDGQMEVFIGGSFVTNDLLKYIADRSPSLKVLRLVSCYSPGSVEGFIKVTRNCPLLEDIALMRCPSIGCDMYDLISDGASVNLKRLEVRSGLYWSFGGCGGEAAAMHGLRELTLTGCDIGVDELAGIVDACPSLECLHVSGSCRIFVDGGVRLRAKCARIKTTTLIP